MQPAPTSSASPTPDSLTSATPTPSPVTLALGGACCLAGAMGVGRFIYTPLLPLMAEAVGLSKTQAGLIASANFLGYLLGALAAALVPLPGSARARLLGALGLGAVTTFGMGLVEGIPAFVVLRFIGGVASALVLVQASSLVIERLVAGGRTGLTALHFAGVGAGIMLSSLLVLELSHAGLSWRAQWFGGGLLHLLAFAGAAVLIRPAPRADPAVAASTRPGRASVGPSPGDRVPFGLVLSYGLFGFGYVTTATFIVAIVRGGAGGSTAEAVVWMAVGLAGMPSVLVWNGLGRRHGILRMYAAACLVEAAGVAASVAPLGLAGLVVSAALLGGTFMAITALGLVAARAFAPAAPARALGLMTAAFGLGQIVGPLVSGAIVDRTGSYLLPSLLSAALLALGALCSGRLQGRLDRIRTSGH